MEVRSYQSNKKVKQNHQIFLTLEISLFKAIFTRQPAITRQPATLTRGLLENSKGLTFLARLF